MDKWAKKRKEEKNKLHHRREVWSEHITVECFETKSIGITTNHTSSKLKLSKHPETSANDQNCWILLIWIFFLLLLTFIKSNFVELKKYFKSPNSVQWIKFIVKFLLILCFWRSVGSGFYKAGNFVAAINAFTAAIVLDDSIPSYPLTEENKFAIILFPCPKPSVTFLSLAQFKRGAQKTLLRILPRLIFDSN